MSYTREFGADPGRRSYNDTYAAMDILSSSFDFIFDPTFEDEFIFHLTDKAVYRTFGQGVLPPPHQSAQQIPPRMLVLSVNMAVEHEIHIMAEIAPYSVGFHPINVFILSDC